jgi:putative ABC transport system permease protein
VSADYFRAMEIPVMRGRGFTEHDTLGAPGVLVISESVARKLWPAGNAVGQRISMDDHPKAGDWLTIVGVVGDVRQQGLNDRLGAVVYQPYAQIRMPGFILRMSFVVRSANTEAMTAAMRAVIRQTDGDLPTDSVTTMTNILSEATLGTQLQARLLGMFAVVALVIAAIGIYGVLAYSVAERLHEFGIRIALGAQQRDILWMILHKTLLLTGAGVVLGMMGGLAVTSVLRQFLFEVTPGDPETFIIVSAVLMAVAIASAWVPVKKAVSVDAQVVLRCE